MKIHHIGYAIKNMERAKDEFFSLGFLPLGNEVVDSSRNVVIQFLSNGEYVVELIAASGGDSPVDNILKKSGNSPYHICYEVEDMKGKIAELEKNGYKRISNPSEAPAIDGRDVCFLYNAHIGLIELVSV